MKEVNPVADMLVNLLKLPDEKNLLEKLTFEGIMIRRVQPYELSLLRKFVKINFNELWADEVVSAFGHQPITCFIATYNKRIVGFGAYECSCRNYFGPTGVQPDFRGKGIGNALLLKCLHAMREMGYAYCIIGGVGPVEFYQKCVGASLIPDSTPGIYIDMLDRDN